MKLILSTFLIAVFAFSASALAKPVALYVSAVDGIATLKSTQETLQNMFRQNLPQVEFRSILVDVPRVFTTPKSQLRNRNELKDKIANVLQPGDEIVYLIVDTHGATTDNQSVLALMGKISADGPDAEFRSLFDVVKDHVSQNLNVMINACSVFEDGEQQSALRAKALLDYFNAPNGTVYGSTNPEMHLAQYPQKYSQGRGLLSPKLSAMVTLNTAMAFFIPILAMTHSVHSAITTDAAFAGVVGVALTTLYISASKFLSWMKAVNVGYLFRFKNGRLEKTDMMKKFEDIERTYSFKASADGKVVSAPLCKAIHL